MILDSLDEIEILSLTIIGESRGESILGQIAVGCDIRNRVIQESQNYRYICLQPKQFSCWNKDDPNYSYLLDLAARMFDGQDFTEGALKQCIYVAHGVFSGDILDVLKQDMFYMTTILFNSPKRPKWASNPKNIIVIGHQTFFNV